MAMVFIGVDPHKLSATIEVVDDHETVLATGRFATDKAGYAAMRKRVAAYRQRTWAVEGSNGAGRPLAQRLLADGEHVVDVPAKLSARVRLFDTGHNRKTDAHDAHAVAVVAVRTKGLRVLSYDQELEALRMVSDRRAELAQHRVQTINRLHRLLSELKPGTSKKDLTALQAKAILASVRPRDLAGKTRRRLAAELLVELFAVDKRIKASTKELNAMVQASGSTLMELPGVGPVVAARILADVGDIARFADRNRFASWTGTAPLDAAAGKTGMEAIRCLKRRISDAVYRHLVADARPITSADVQAGPGGHCGASHVSCAAGSNPRTGTSDQPLPGPAPTTLAARRAAAHPLPGSALQPKRRRAGAVKVERPTGRTT